MPNFNKWPLNSFIFEQSIPEKLNPICWQILLSIPVPSIPLAVVPGPGVVYPTQAVSTNSDLQWNFSSRSEQFGSQPVGLTPFGKLLSQKIFTLWFRTIAKLQLRIVMKSFSDWSHHEELYQRAATLGRLRTTALGRCGRLGILCWSLQQRKPFPEFILHAKKIKSMTVLPHQIEALTSCQLSLPLFCLYFLFHEVPLELSINFSYCPSVSRF